MFVGIVAKYHEPLERLRCADGYWLERVSLECSMTEERRELLLHMYDQMFNDIDRHILVVWQSIGVLIGAFAVFALTEKQIITIDIATSLVLLLCGWLIAH